MNRSRLSTACWALVGVPILAVGASTAQQLTCPSMPNNITQVNRDVRSEVQVGIGSLGKLKAGEIGVKTDVVAKNLFDKYPNTDRIVVVQMMAATYCSIIRDSKGLKDSERLRLWSEFSERVFKFESPAYNSSPAPPPKPKGNVAPADKGKQGALAGNNSPNISQIGPCNLAQTGDHNTATVNCGPPSGAELAKFSSGTSVQIVTRTLNQSPIAIATGFWLNKKGYIATCLHSLQGVGISAQVPIPPLLGNALTVASGALTTGLQPIISDPKSDVAIMHVIGSPFERSMHVVAMAQGLDNNGQPLGAPEITQEQYWVPVLADVLAHDGDDIIEVSFIQDHAMPLARYDFGHIVRMGVNSTSSEDSYRIFTSFQYKDSDCGAPVINNAKTVVGMMHGPNGEAIPSTYILNLLKKSE